MIGSPLVGWWIAHIVFWALIARAVKDARWSTIGVMMTLWVVGYVASGEVTGLSLFFTPYVAVLDIALVFIVLQLFW